MNRDNFPNEQRPVEQPPYDQQQPYPDYALEQAPATSRLGVIDQLVAAVQATNPLVLGAAGIVLALCVLFACIASFALINGSKPPAPAADIPTIDANMIFATQAAQTMAVQQVTTPLFATSSIFGSTPAVFATTVPIIATTVPSVSDGTLLVNPYQDANLSTMTQLQIAVLNPANNTMELRATLTGDNLAPFITALNIAQPVSAPTPGCSNQVMFRAIRSDGSTADFSACLNGAVILRGAGIPSLANGNDLAMGPYFIDILLPYVPEYANLLQ